MAESPRVRRLRADRKALEALKAESTIFDFAARGELPDTYTLVFNGRGIWRPEQGAGVQSTQRHEVYLRLGAAYPRMMPELTWRSPIFHPNISASGVVCLGGYGTYWVPSLSLDELCTMLWDMIRYANYDPNSPYNRDAAIWAKSQDDYALPLDHRPIRDRVAQKPRANPLTSAGLPPKPRAVVPIVVPVPNPLPMAIPLAAAPRAVQPTSDGITFLEDEYALQAEVVERGDAGSDEIVFID
jgi:ubiquitin-protein ligase